MSSEDAKASFFGGREEEDEEDKRSKRRVQKKTTRTTTTRTTTTTDEDDFSEDTQPSLETALIGSSLAVESPTITSVFKSMSYPSLCAAALLSGIKPEADKVQAILLYTCCSVCVVKVKSS